MALTATRLRQDIFKILDQVLDSGVPVEIERRGRRLRIVAVAPVSKLSNLIRRQAIAGDPDDLPEVQASDPWVPEEIE